MIRKLGTALLAVVAGVTATPLAAQTGGGDAQLLYGGGFNDGFTGNSTVDGRMATLTLEHFGGWALGDHFFFVDVTSGTFDAEADRGYRMYSEWAPRLSLGQLTGRALAVGPVSDVLIAGEVHAASSGYAAGLIGPGVNLAVPGFAMLSAAVLYRDDNFNPGTWQLTSAWAVPVRLGVDVTLAGFVDVIGAPNGNGIRVMTQPQVLVELGSLVGATRRDVQVGVEWYAHRDGTEWHTVPQGVVRWAW